MIIRELLKNDGSVRIGKFGRNIRSQRVISSAFLDKAITALFEDPVIALPEEVTKQEKLVHVPDLH